MGTSSDDWALRWILESQDSTHMEANHKRALKAEILNAIMNKDEFQKIQNKFSTLEIAKSPKKKTGVAPAPVTNINRTYGHMPIESNPDPSNPLNTYSARGQLPAPPTAYQQAQQMVKNSTGPPTG